MSQLSMDEVTEIITQIGDEVGRLEWSLGEAQDYLDLHYGRRSRWLLPDHDLIDCLRKLREL